MARLVTSFTEARLDGVGRAVVEPSGPFGGRPSLGLAGAGKDTTLTLPIHLTGEGRHAARLTAFSTPAGGVFDVLWDGSQVATAQMWAAEPGEVDLSLGTLVLSPGRHELTFRARSAGNLSVEVLRLLPLPAEAVRSWKTENEAHFVRIAIGGAVYAHRLAFGVLPESLEELVADGILAERWLRDENGAPLSSWREGDHFVAQSGSKDGWRQPWRGLDARR
jgi:hypothetical protein